MPQSAAIAAVTPFVPSPLTVKMAMVASLLQGGEYNQVENLVQNLPKMEVRIVPPTAATSFKALLRYRSVPSVESVGRIDEVGSLYPSRPHTREYTLYSDELVLFVGLPRDDLKPLARAALQNIRYLGCKDSIVWCREVIDAQYIEVERAHAVRPLSESRVGFAVLLADFSPTATVDGLRDIIHGNRKEQNYRIERHVLPGELVIKGRTSIFKRQG